MTAKRQIYNQSYRISTKLHEVATYQTSYGVQATLMAQASVDSPRHLWQRVCLLTYPTGRTGAFVWTVAPYMQSANDIVGQMARGTSLMRKRQAPHK